MAQRLARLLRGGKSSTTNNSNKQQQYAPRAPLPRLRGKWIDAQRRDVEGESDLRDVERPSREPYSTNPLAARPHPASRYFPRYALLRRGRCAPACASARLRGGPTTAYCRTADVASFGSL